MAWEPRVDLDLCTICTDSWQDGYGKFHFKQCEKPASSWFLNGDGSPFACCSDCLTDEMGPLAPSVTRFEAEILIIMQS